MFTEDDLLPISALQHLEFCPRRCALIHIEGIWAENAQTAEGRVLHQRVHQTAVDNIEGVRTARGLRLRSLELGLFGVADVVEFRPLAHDAPGGATLPNLPGRWQPFPVEYKRGKRKPEKSYFVQLCAQALCLEEMLKTDVPAGALYHGQSRRRQAVAFDPDLRRHTRDLAQRLHDLIAAGRPPPAARRRPPAAAAVRAASVSYLADILRQMQASLPVDVARGKEGEAARSYFVAFGELIVQQKADFFFHERSRRPPLDNMNALMSFLYAMLTTDVASGCESVGLDPQMGFLHGDRSGRPSLALDLMEEFRPMIADRLALSLVNRQQVEGKGFTKTETGGVEMDDATRKSVLVAYQKRKDEEIFHPFLKEKITVGLLPFVQARLLARWLRGELDAYPPFFWK